MEEVDEIRNKRKRIEVDIARLLKSADHLANKAESTGQLTLITQSNSLRRTAKNKQSGLLQVQEELDEMLKKLKN